MRPSKSKRPAGRKKSVRRKSRSKWIRLPDIIQHPAACACNSGLTVSERWRRFGSLSDWRPLSDAKLFGWGVSSGKLRPPLFNTAGIFKPTIPVISAYGPSLPFVATHLIVSSWGKTGHAEDVSCTGNFDPLPTFRLSSSVRL